PGASISQLPDEVGILVPKGAYIVMQVHYNLSGVDAASPDQTRVGLYFHPNPPRKRLLTLPLLNDQFTLEPGAIGKEVDATLRLDFAALGLPLPNSLFPTLSAIRVGPHMHQLGRKIGLDLTQPDGAVVPLIEIDDWDFHWQSLYDYVTPVALPTGSTLKLSCVFDNPTDRAIGWGESTQDEMCLAYVGFT